MNITYYAIHYVLSLFIILFLFLFFLLIINRIIYKKKYDELKTVKLEVDFFLTSIIFDNHTNDELKLKINNFKKTIPFKKQLYKNLVLKQIVRLKLNLKGEVINKVVAIYENFDLFKFSLNSLKSSHIRKISRGIYHFQSLEYADAEIHLEPLLKHKNYQISSNSYIAKSSISSDNLNFLIDFDKKITLADEIKIMDILYSKRPKMPSNLNEWLYSKNPSVIILGIKFMVFYKYTNEINKILSLLDNENQLVRAEAINAVKDLYIYHAEQLIITQFNYETPKNKIVILKALGAIGTYLSIHFIKKLIINPDFDDEIKLVAMYSLKKLDNSLDESQFVDNSKVIQMIKHVKNKFI